MTTLICERQGDDVRIMRCRDYVEPRCLLQWTQPLLIRTLISMGEIERFGETLGDIVGLDSRIVTHVMTFERFMNGDGYPHPIDTENFVYMYDNGKWYIGKPFSKDTAFPLFESLADMIDDPYDYQEEYDRTFGEDADALPEDEADCETEMDVYNHIGWHERL